jgi:hypothetical protein
MVPTKCQSKPPAGSTGVKPSSWFDSVVKAVVTYNLTNGIEDYGSYEAKVSGDQCNYVNSRLPEGKFSSDFLSCAIPNNITRTTNGTLVKP